MTKPITRRTMLQSLLGTAAVAAVGLPALEAFAQRRNGQPTGQEKGEMGRLAAEFRRKYRVPASAIAITRSGEFVYDQAAGMADRQQLQPVQQNSLFRIASVTKPITSVTIFSLLEQGKLNLKDKVFGPSGILGNKYGKPPYKQYVPDVTVDNLLTHTSGGWPNDGTDPMFRFNSWDHTRLITWTLANLPLTYPPGEHWAYSNFGYCVLGRVIEAVTGQPYDAYVKANILAPCGITDMKIAENKMKERAPNEVVYYGQYGENPYGFNVTRMDSNGGWIASAQDLAIFLDHVAGAGNIPALLKPETIKLMTTPAPAYPQGDARYARGWMVRDNGKGNWWHNGGFPGTTTIMVRTANGMCWGGLTNTSFEPSGEMSTALDNLIWNMVRTIPGWQ
jgi:CubicO group peptidase (beta-lactamase class C family)